MSNVETAVAMLTLSWVMWFLTGIAVGVPGVSPVDSIFIVVAGIVTIAAIIAIWRCLVLGAER